MIFSSNTIITTKYTIYIDPGHGGYDGGAIVNDIKESDINLLFALKLENILTEQGYNVEMTRQTDIDLSDSDKFIKREDLNKRVDLINSSDCLLYISLHQNYYSNSIYSGSQVFYSATNDLSKSLAQNIEESIKFKLNNTTRTSKLISDVYMLYEIDKPGVLIECGFMSNETEFALLLDENYQEKFAYCIYYGILNYLLLF